MQSRNSNNIHPPWHAALKLAIIYSKMSSEPTQTLSEPSHDKEWANGLEEHLKAALKLGHLGECYRAVADVTAKTTILHLNELRATCEANIKEQEAKTLASNKKIQELKEKIDDLQGQRDGADSQSKKWRIIIKDRDDTIKYLETKVSLKEYFDEIDENAAKVEDPLEQKNAVIGALRKRIAELQMKETQRDMGQKLQYTVEDIGNQVVMSFPKGCKTEMVNVANYEHASRGSPGETRVRVHVNSHGPLSPAATEVSSRRSSREGDSLALISADNQSRDVEKAESDKRTRNTDREGSGGVEYVDSSNTGALVVREDVTPTMSDHDNDQMTWVLQEQAGDAQSITVQNENVKMKDVDDESQTITAEDLNRSDAQLLREKLDKGKGPKKAQPKMPQPKPLQPTRRGLRSTTTTTTGSTAGKDKTDQTGPRVSPDRSHIATGC